MTPRIAGLREIADRFDAVLLDQFGVLHDGRTAFPGAVACVAALKAAGRRLAVVTNSGKGAGPNRDRLAALGFAPDLFDAVITSGDVCRGALAALPQSASVFVIARDGDRSALAGLALRETADPREADAVLLAGAEPERMTQDGYRALLAPAAARGAPLFCANPDLRMYVRGGTAFGAGAVARDYAATGAPVRWFGKPHPEIFAAALAALDTAPARAVMVGDSAAHDVGGAKLAGCAWVLVEGGVYAGAAQDVPESGGWAMASLAW
ncbi:TIGR01459 family HAD-type hydrolase [Rubrimonas cliftonensis]|uniref:HAD-superfamily class IIA hydrolase, TIGR01459 n=1 Tax=Rubrimonas cliftonensis TaxID=89524 RepID=A0A1H4C4B2_9RHOB|nr:TIGR01459 family HAD-type hydrolase [Rubrimonas cliftonensis]SEA55167.1 HAD-superfamily class IIA hydrolase, TIGR01459 [Rubrimonas cliftonensis]